MKQYLLGCLLVLLSSDPIWSDNGDSASALEATGIVIDGDLSDWPTHIQWHAIGETISGDKPMSDTDLKAVFATAFDPSDTTLVVGIRVEDESVISDSTGAGPSDEAHVYYSQDHRRAKTISSAKPDSTVLTASHHTANVLTYEWRIPLSPIEEARLSGAIPIGFDVVIRDVDEDRSVSSVAWGPRWKKRRGSRYLQDLFIGRQISSGQMEGSVKWEDAGEGRLFGKLRIASMQYPEKPFHVFLNKPDRFEIDLLPEGSYEISIGYFGHWAIVDTVDVTDNVHIELPPSLVAKPPGGRVEEHIIESTALVGNYAGEDPKRRIRIYLPEGYENSTDVYPVVYRLPGWTGRFDHGRVRVDKAIREGRIAPIIEVAIDGDTQYAGTLFKNSPAFGNWEDFLIDEVIPFVDARYRTIQGPQGRALTGFSMGGWSALILSVFRPGIWGAIGLNDPSFWVMWEMTHDKEDSLSPEYFEETLEAFRTVPSSLAELKSVQKGYLHILVRLGATFGFDANAPLWASYPRNKNGEWNPEVRERWDAYNLIRADVLARHKDSMLQLGTIAIVIPDDPGGNELAVQIWRDAGITIETIDMPGGHGYQQEERFITLTERMLKALNHTP